MNKKTSGFSIVELIIATIILVTISLVVSNLLFTVLKNALKAEIAKEVRQNGTYVLNIIEDQIKNSSEVISACDGNNRSFVEVKLPSNEIVKFDYQLNAIFKVDKDINGITLSQIQLTSNKVNVTSFTASCTPVVDNYNSVAISFTLTQADQPVNARAEEQAAMDFTTTILTRNN